MSQKFVLSSTLVFGDRPPFVVLGQNETARAAAVHMCAGFVYAKCGLPAFVLCKHAYLASFNIQSLFLI